MGAGNLVDLAEEHISFVLKEQKGYWIIQLIVLRNIYF